MVAAEQEIASSWIIQKNKNIQSLQAPGWASRSDVFFVVLFQSLLLICSGLLFLLRFLSRSDPTPEFLSFQFYYYVNFFLAFASDALQWPYLYAFYESIGFSKEEITYQVAVYFLAAAASAPLIGASANKWRRKHSGFYYGVATTVGCLTAYSQNFWILLFGRICSGISMAVLSTGFEAWMVTEHLLLGFRGEWLYSTFCGLSFGAPVVMLAMSAVANLGVHIAGAGFTAPFYLSIIPAVAITILSILERPTMSADPGGTSVWVTMRSAWTILKQDKILVLSAFLETTCGVPLLVVPLLWAPTIIDDGRSIPLGLFFACMAACAMIGSTLAGILVQGGALHQQLYSLLPYQCIAGLALAIPIGTQEEDWQLFSFCIFYFCAGVISPCLARLRSLCIPEGHRGVLTGLLKSPACILTAIVVYLGQSTFTLLLCVFLFCLSSVPPLASSWSKRIRVESRESGRDIDAGKQ